jgi:hypothetical protein
MIRTAAALAMRMAAIVRTAELDIRTTTALLRLVERDELRLLLPGYLLAKKYSHVSESQNPYLRGLTDWFGPS